jgi:hypothetical protein
MAPRGPSAELADAWFVQAQGRSWGPYSTGRIVRFVDEGRVAASTLLGRASNGPFAPAAEVFGALFEGAAPAAQPQPQLQAREAPSSAEARPLLICATLSSLTPERFEAALAIFGDIARIRPGVWLLRATLNASALRNALSRRLGAADVLLVVEAPLAQAAWFNLDGEADRRLRSLWAK